MAVAVTGCIAEKIILIYMKFDSDNRMKQIDLFCSFGVDIIQ